MSRVSYTRCDGCGDPISGAVPITIGDKDYHSAQCVSTNAWQVAWYDAEWVERQAGAPIPAPCGRALAGGGCVLPVGHVECGIDHLDGESYMWRNEVPA